MGWMAALVMLNTKVSDYVAKSRGGWGGVVEAERVVHRAGEAADPGSKDSSAVILRERSRVASVLLPKK